MGIAALMAGDLEAASSARRWVAGLWGAQRGLPRVLVTATDGEGRLMVPPPHEVDLRWETVIDFSRPRQAFANPGITAAFLARYSMRTGDTDALQLARDYLSLSEGGTSRQFDGADSVQICKLGWGASVLLEADPDVRYLEWVRRMGEWFIAVQQPDGRWRDSPFRRDREAPEGQDLAVTAEFVQHVGTIVTALGGRDRPPARPRTG
jgi:hypothetical protein